MARPRRADRYGPHNASARARLRRRRTPPRFADTPLARCSCPPLPLQAGTPHARARAHANMAAAAAAALQLTIATWDDRVFSVEIDGAEHVRRCLSYFWGF